MMRRYYWYLITYTDGQTQKRVTWTDDDGPPIEEVMARIRTWFSTPDVASVELTQDPE